MISSIGIVNCDNKTYVRVITATAKGSHSRFIGLDVVIRTIGLLLITAFFCSCASPKQNQNYGPLTIEGSSFKTIAAPLFTNAVESSIVDFNSNLTFLTDQGMNGNLSVNSQSVGQGYRFAYIMQNNGVYYNFFQLGGDIAVKTSTDLVTWSNEQVVLHASNDNFLALWNPSVTVDNNGVWHMLVECAADGNNAHAGLCYSFATIQNGTLNFDTNKQATLATTLAGNAWMQYVPGKGILVIYGKIVNGLWEVRAGILDSGLITESSTFKINAPGIHICDPHAIETTDGVILTLSYDQYSIYELKTTQTMSELFDVVNQ